MVIVQGEFMVLPEERDRFLGARVELMRSFREEDGCQEYVLAADPVDPGRVVVSERWESMDHLQRHLDGLATRPADPGGQPLPQPVSAAIVAYDISASRRLR